MKKQRYMMAVILLLAVSLLCGCDMAESPELSAEPETVEAATVPATEPTQESAEKDSYPAPDFTMVDADGNEVKLSDFFGKPIILNFWASWCGPCKSEMPDFEAAYLVYGEEIHFLMVNMTDGERETMESAGAFLADAGYSFPVYYDVNYDGAMTYGISAIPTTYFVDAQGNLVAYAQRALTAEMLQQGIDMIIEADNG